MHMVRNAVDHGIEAPRTREAAGKARAGVVRLSAYQSGGSVVVEMVDDGAGLDRARILERAIDTGLMASTETLSDHELYNLIFAPGFSTAPALTDLSGRGVGLDVVMRNVRALRGRVDIASTPGAGCTFTMRVPLTLAITDGMIVRVGAERYIVPTHNIVVSFRPDRDALSTVVQRGEVVMLRDAVLPIVRLHKLFGVHDAVEDPTRGLLVVVGAGERECALLVDELVSQQQVVAKSLGAGIGAVDGISGGAILGDGRVGLILDIGELIALVRRGSREGMVSPRVGAVA
jgi:two-component system chemotaxis sensor kinase CheA